jgi:hypothetical protein
MYTTIVDYLSTPLVAAALVASGLWFYAGSQYLAKKNRIGGFAWQIIGVFLLGAFCVHAVLSRGWYSLIIALAALTVELWLIRRQWRENHLPQI